MSVCVQNSEWIWATCYSELVFDLSEIVLRTTHRLTDGRTSLAYASRPLRFSHVFTIETSLRLIQTRESWLWWVSFSAHPARCKFALHECVLLTLGAERRCCPCPRRRLAVTLLMTSFISTLNEHKPHCNVNPILLSTVKATIHFPCDNPKRLAPAIHTRHSYVDTLLKFSCSL